MRKIKKIREKLGLSQSSLAEKLNITQQAIAKWEKGEALPSGDKLPKLAAILGCTIDELYEEETAK